MVVPGGKFLLIRTDANTRIGTGHLMRCLALAQAWQAQGGQAVFITSCDSDGLRQRLAAEGFQTVFLERSYPDSSDWDATSEVLAAHSDAWVVLDGYHFSPTYQRQIIKFGHRLLVIDDMAHLAHYYANILLNQNIHAAELDYVCEPDTCLLLGTRYALLRREFWLWREWQRAIPDVAHKVLVTLGGADPDNATLQVIQALRQAQVAGLEARVVVGGNNPHWESLHFASEQSGREVRLERDVKDMPALMAWADVAISAGGSTCWELAFMGLPTLVLVTAGNQIGVAEGLDTLGVVKNLGRWTGGSEIDLARALKELVGDSARRSAMSEGGRQLVDGGGAGEVISRMNCSAESVFQVDRLQIRPARPGDGELLWQWANDPIVRANSFHSEVISLSNHMEWYRKKLMSSDTCIWILELDSVPVGQIRYDRVNSDTADIDFSVTCRGQGLGTQALLLSCFPACDKLQVKRLRGIVFCSNEPSVRAFTKAGFESVGQKKIQGVLCSVFERDCT